MSRTYQLLQRAWGPAPAVRDAIIMMIVLAALVTTLAIAQIARRHDVVRAGYELSQETQTLEELRARHRDLEVEHAMLTDPSRLRELATQLGMVPAQPDAIRVVKRSKRVATGEQREPDSVQAGPAIPAAPGRSIAAVGRQAEGRP